MDASTVDSIEKLAVDAARARVLGTATPTIVLRDDEGTERVVSLEPFAAARARFRGTYNTSSLQDFARYVIGRGAGDGFIQPDALSATVIFNLHVAIDPGSPSEPGHADDIAQLALKSTPDYEALKLGAGSTFVQKQVVEWLEDWADNLTADFSDGTTSGSTADPTAIKRAIAALRRVKIKASSEAVHTDKDFGASRSALEDIEASSESGLPAGFRFTCQPAPDLSPRTFYLRLRVHPADDKPTFQLRWIRRESDLEAIGQDFKAKLLDAIGDKASMLLGTFSAGA